MNPSFDIPAPAAPLFSQAQYASMARSLVIGVASGLGGWAMGHGWITQDQAAAIMSNEQVLGAITTLLIAGMGGLASAAAGIWGVADKTQVKMVAAVAAMPEVAEVKTTATTAGIELRNAVNDAGPVPGALVTVEGR